jgi:hypothetical protein
MLKKIGLMPNFILTKRKYFVLALLSLCILMAPVTSADLGTPINSRWAYTIPTIDGTISGGEWTDATIVDFILEMRQCATGDLNETLDARFYVKNNLTHIYAAVQIFNEDYDAQNGPQLHYDTFALLFEDDHDHILEDGDNGVAVDIWSGGPSHYHNDWFWVSSGSYWDLDFWNGGSDDGALNWSHTNPTEEAIGNYTFEMRIPLVGSDGDAYDLAITTLPETVGFKIYFHERDECISGVFPDNSTINDNREEISDGNTFGNLILHPQYTLTITTTAGGTTNPSPGIYYYGWGEVENVLAIPSGGYVFDQWELDSVPVGSVNPYSVTMDMDHTLHAVFMAYVPPAVGVWQHQ